mmetsp:Transcript_20669/g.48216  ORF Transcript_20669/g.48216 Transcript_20669/m.48216 type:complete len:140 (+) Transcript_20669:80-499(+)|eukprot:CAMPEP_0171068712 /NCGR_PEP_ID=MMETSP0766_2-20121228/8726_1 /TAXON_ID=439317 /ORGANISM="Gambierdiscus australes, Strain CAWD 149" /LENGTH=139 /DNA_ID=CAMNT_0011525055 /DNA_START=76 /DNA_END=495 /DNA_ORIENTATION=-
MVVKDLTEMAMPIQAAMIGTVILWFLNVVVHVKSADPANFKGEYSEVNPEKRFNPWARSAGNMVESVPLAVAILWGAIIAGGHPLALTITISLFTLFRVLFVVLYVNMVQPARSLAFGFGQLSMLATGIIGILGAFGIA